MTESSKSYFESRPSFLSSSEVLIPVPNATRWPSQKHDASRSGQNHHAQGRRLIRGLTVEPIWRAGVADPEAECAPVNIDDHFADMCAQTQVTLHDCLSEAQSWWTDAQEEISGLPLVPPPDTAEALDRALNNCILASFAENVRVKIDLDFLSMRATSSQIITTDKMGRLHPLLFVPQNGGTTGETETPDT